MAAEREVRTGKREGKDRQASVARPSSERDQLLKLPGNKAEEELAKASRPWLPSRPCGLRAGNLGPEARGPESRVGSAAPQATV